MKWLNHQSYLLIKLKKTKLMKIPQPNWERENKNK